MNVVGVVGFNRREGIGRSWGEWDGNDRGLRRVVSWQRCLPKGERIIGVGHWRGNGVV